MMDLLINKILRPLNTLNNTPQNPLYFFQIVIKTLHNLSAL